MKFLIILIVTTTVVRGHRHARYYETEYKMPQRYPRYRPSYVEHNRHYRDSFRQSPQPYLEEPHYRDQPPSNRDEKYFSDLRPYSDHNLYYSERPPSFMKKPSLSFHDHEPLTSYGNQQEVNFNSYTSHSLNDATPSYPTQEIHTDAPRQSLSFGGHSNYMKFGNHALGFASVPLQSTAPDNSESPLPSPTATAIISTTSTPSAHANDQSNTSKILQLATEMARPMIDSNTANNDAAKNKGETTDNSMSDKTSKPLITASNMAAEPKPPSSGVSSGTPTMIMPSPEMKRMPFGISFPLMKNPYLGTSADLRYNNFLDESKGYQTFDFQQSAAPEVLSYMLPPQISTPVKISLPTLPISSLSTSASSPFAAIKFVPHNIPKLTFMNHDTIQPQTSLSLATAFPVSEFGQNAVQFGQNALQLGQIGQLDAQRQDVLQGLHLDLDGFGGIGGINYGAQASSSIAKPAVLGIAKVGLSLPEASRSIIPTFTKIGFGQQLW